MVPRWPRDRLLLGADGKPQYLGFAGLQRAGPPAQRLHRVDHRRPVVAGWDDAVFFGKASSCENPVLIRLNNRDKFLPAFRAAHQPPDLPGYEPEEDQNEDVAEEANGEPEAPGDFDDDIPF